MRRRRAVQRPELRTGPRRARGDRPMSAVLIVRPSSLGDIVYALSVATDIRRERPGFAVDWVAEPGFAPLIGLCPDVREVMPFNLRRWRGALGARATWREMRDFAHALRRTRYDAVLDLQEQVKGAMIARMARGLRHGFDRASIREPLATLATMSITGSPATCISSRAAVASRPRRSATRSTTRPAGTCTRPPTQRPFPIDLTSSCSTGRAGTRSCGRRRTGAR